jgi:hypothetical protein
VVITATLLDTLPTPFADGVDKVYRQLKDILSIITAQQAESSLQRRVEVSISSPDHSKASQQKAATELLVVWTTAKHGPGYRPVRMRVHSPSTVHVTHAMVGMTTGRGTTLVLRDHGLGRLKAMCLMRVSQKKFGH